MTPKEKEKELVEKMAIYHWTDVCDYEGAKQCALIAVDEVLEILYKILKVTASSYVIDQIEHYLEVKQEIEKL
jgi:hypothetical protein